MEAVSQAVAITQIYCVECHKSVASTGHPLNSNITGFNCNNCKNRLAILMPHVTRLYLARPTVLLLIKDVHCTKCSKSTEGIGYHVKYDTVRFNCNDCDSILAILRH